MRRAAVALGVALLLTACPGNQKGQDESQNSPSKTSTTTANPQAVPENSTAMNPVTTSQAAAAASIPIQVQLTEYEIRMPDAIPAGTQTFHIADGGHENHNFVIEGNGVSQRLANDLTRGDTADLTVTLKPGTYSVYCPVDKHRARGMQRTITVK
jgi:plastocyanin